MAVVAAAVTSGMVPCELLRPSRHHCLLLLLPLLLLPDNTSGPKPTKHLSILLNRKLERRSDAPMIAVFL